MCDQRRGGRGEWFPGTHSQYILMRDQMCLPMSDDISYETGVLFGDTLGVTFHAIKRLRLMGFETVLITGQGPIGLSATMLCKFLNAFVIVLDVDRYRLTHAQLCGADVCVNPDAESDVLERLREIAGPRGIDVALDCSGNPVAQRRSDSIRRRDAGGLAINTGKHFIGKELELIGSWYAPVSYLNSRRSTARAYPQTTYPQTTLSLTALESKNLRRHSIRFSEVSPLQRRSSIRGGRGFFGISQRALDNPLHSHAILHARTLVQAALPNNMTHSTLTVQHPTHPDPVQQGWDSPKMGQMGQLGQTGGRLNFKTAPESQSWLSFGWGRWGRWGRHFERTFPPLKVRLT